MTSLRIAFTSVDWNFVSWEIRKTSGGAMSHCMLVVCEYNVPKRYYESIAKTDPATGKDGVRGPIPWQNVTDWQKESKSNHLWLSDALPLNDDEIEEIETQAKRDTQTVSYAFHHCVEDWFAAKTGFSVTRIGRKLFTEGKRKVIGNIPQQSWNCSEFCMRKMPLRMWPGIRVGETLWEWYVPSGATLPSVESWLKKHGIEVKPISGATGDSANLKKSILD